MDRRRRNAFRRDGSGLRSMSAVASRAFTLIELLVVIAIIALLTAILVPTLSRVRRQAKTMVCQARLRQWGTALAIYTEDNQGRFPTTSMGYDGVWLLRGGFLSERDPNAPQDSIHHFHTKDIVCCPVATGPSTDRIGGIGSTSGNVSIRVGSRVGAWEITLPGPPFRGSYGYNQWLFRGFRRSYSDVVRVQRAGRIEAILDVLSLRGRANIPVLLDASFPWSAPLDNETPPLTGEGGDYNGMSNFCINRHDGYVNGLFLDWSVRKVGVKELWTLNWYTEFNRAGRWTKAGGRKPRGWPRWMWNSKDY